MSSSKTTTTTPSNPAWVDSSLQGVASNIGGLAGTNPNQYVAGASPLQQLQFGLAGSTGATAANDLAQASANATAAGAAPANTYNPATMTAATVGAPATAASGIAQYLNPYTQAVTNATNANLNQGNQLALNDVDQGAELAGGYGGSRQGVAESQTNKNFENTLATTDAGLNQNNYTTALGAANNDADRAQTGQDLQATLNQQAAANNQSAQNQAGQYNAGAADTADARQLASAGALGGLATTGLNQLDNSGSTQQAINQAQAGAPLTVAQQLAAALGGIGGNLNLEHGSTQTEQSSNPLGSIASLAGLVAAPFTGGASLGLGSMLSGLGLGAAAGGAGTAASGVAGLTGLF